MHKAEATLNKLEADKKQTLIKNLRQENNELKQAADLRAKDNHNTLARAKAEQALKNKALDEVVAQLSQAKHKAEMAHKQELKQL